MTNDDIINAAQTLASVCDGAISDDGQGYNGRDAPFVHSVLGQEFPPTPKQITAIYKILRTYKVQLSGMGIEYDDLELDSGKPEILKTDVRRHQIDPSWKDFRIYFGKHEGESFYKIFIEDPHYLKWITENFDDGDIKTAAIAILSDRNIKRQDVISEGITLDYKDGKIGITSPFAAKFLYSELSIREWDKDLKKWTCPSMIIDEIIETFHNSSFDMKTTDAFEDERDRIDTLKVISNAVESDFNLDHFGNGRKLMPFQNAGVNFLEVAIGGEIDYLKCPLYYIIGDENNAKWNIQENRICNEKTIGKPEERPRTGSQKESNCEIKSNSRRSGMEKDGINQHNNCNASTGHKEKTSGRIRKCPEEIWNKLEGWEWSRTHRNNENIFDDIETNGVCDGILNTSEIESNWVSECSGCLQSRLCPHTNENGSRNRRSIPHNTNSERTRCEERKNTESPWVDCNTLRSRCNIRNGGVMIADSMGLGKTAQALAYLQLHPKLRPAIIICPASLKYNWRNECEMWLETDDTIEIINDGKLHKLEADITIINYDLISKWNQTIKSIRPQVVIFDESHYLKNQKASRSKAAKDIGTSTPHRILLTGTPVLNRPNELWNQLQILDPVAYSDKNFFRWHLRYADATEGSYGWDFSGASNIKELAENLKHIMIRRTKDQVLPELPDKRQSSIIVPITNRKDYRKAESEFFVWVAEQKGLAAAKRASRVEQLTKIEYLKQIAAIGKLKDSIAWISDFLESGEKLVVFANHKATIHAIEREFGNIAVKIDGSVSVEARQMAVEKFQNDPKVKLFIGNIKASGIGITLTAASDVIFLELPWTPAELDQAADRVHRIGQKNSVNVYYLLGDNTIDENIAIMIESKRKVINGIMSDDKSKTDFNLFDLMEME